MEKIISENITVVFAILGTITGSIFTFIGTWILQYQNAKYRLLEKVLDKRIEAHEKILAISKYLRQFHSLGYLEKEGELARTPVIMSSLDSFNDFLSKFSQTNFDNSSWLTIEVNREINLIQDAKSASNRTAIPEQIAQQFRGKSHTDSGANRTLLVGGEITG